MKHKILVIEDDAGIRDGLFELLDEEGYAATLAINGQQALEILSRDPGFSVILLDLMMPVMDGYDFLKKLESDHPDILNRIPILLLTAAGDRAPSVKNVRAVIKKPIDIDVLLNTMEKFR